MRILLVKTSSMGDIVHALPVINDIKVNYREAKIDWLIEKSFTSLLNTHQHINNIIPISWRSWRKNLFSKHTYQQINEFYHTINQQNYDYIIDMQGLLKSAIPAYLAKHKISKIYGYSNKSKEAGFEKIAKIFYDKKITIPYICHTVTRNRLLCAGALNYKIDENEVNFLFKPQQNNIKHILDNKPYIIFGHGTSRENKEWNIQNWINLGIKINEYQPNTVILLPWGNEQEKHTANLIMQGIKIHQPYANIRVLVQLNLDKLVSIIQGAYAYIGTDTGLSHIASALGIASIIIYNFDTMWRTNAFWQPNTYSLYEPNGVSLDGVWNNLHTIF